MKRNGKSAVSSAVSMKSNTSATLSSAHDDKVMFFRDVKLGPQEVDLRFRLIHFWEARNPNTKTLIGQEMLLIDEEGAVIQGYVPSGRVGSYELISGCVYKLRNFFGSRNKTQYRVSDHNATVTFAWNSELSVVDNPPVSIPEDRFSGPVMKLYLWDKAASDFCEKFKSYGSTPSIILVTTVNPKHLGRSIYLVMYSLGVVEIQLGNCNKINAEVVTKPETATLEELFSYIKLPTAKVAWFECTATIDDVIQGSACEVAGVAQYLTRISVYDKSEQAVFVILGDAGKELTGKHASELVATDHCVPVPQALLDTIGQTHRFIVKVSDHNLKEKTQTITVTKILPPEAPHPVEPLVEDAIPATSDGFLKTGSEVSGSSSGLVDAAGGRVRKASESIESDEAKRSKSG
ncbi:hypothetical protein Bca101_002749 [Brassica carinata]